MAGEDRRPSTVLPASPFIEVTDTTVASSPAQSAPGDRTPSPTDEIPSWTNCPKLPRHRGIGETQYADTEVEELLSMLRETESLEEQGDILQYLVSYKHFAVTLTYIEYFCSCIIRMHQNFTLTWSP